MKKFYPKLTLTLPDQVKIPYGNNVVSCLNPTDEVGTPQNESNLL